MTCLAGTRSSILSAGSAGFTIETCESVFRPFPLALPTRAAHPRDSAQAGRLATTRPPT